MARQADRGAVAVLAVFFILTMGAFLALSFNIGLIFKARGELQGAADAAALAAAGSLDGTAGGLFAGRVAARAFAAAHDVAGQPVALSEVDDVRYGFWHFDRERCAYGNGTCRRGFERAPDPTGRPFAVTAVEVANGRDLDPNHNGPLPVIFGVFLQRDRPFTLGSSAVALGRRGRVDCALPIGVFECRDDLLTDGELRCNGAGELDAPVVFTGGNTDELVRVNLFSDATPSRGRTLARLLGNQEDCADTDFQTGSAPIATGGGDAFLRPLADALLGFDEDEPAGSCLLGEKRTIPVVECRGRRGNQRTVVGFVNVRIEAITCPNGTPAACGRTNPCGRGGGRESVSLRVLCDDPAGPTGGPGLKLRLMR
jgi:hypothetical protein